MLTEITGPFVEARYFLQVFTSLKCLGFDDL